MRDYLFCLMQQIVQSAYGRLKKATHTFDLLWSVLLERGIMISSDATGRSGGGRGSSRIGWQVGIGGSSSYGLWNRMWYDVILLIVI